MAAFDLMAGERFAPGVIALAARDGSVRQVADGLAFLLIVRELLAGPKRYTDLRQGLPGPATDLLATRLRELQEAGLVDRREVPPPTRPRCMG